MPPPSTPTPKRPPSLARTAAPRPPPPTAGSPAAPLPPRARPPSPKTPSAMASPPSTPSSLRKITGPMTASPRSTSPSTPRPISRSATSSRTSPTPPGASPESSAWKKRPLIPKWPAPARNSTTSSSVIPAELSKLKLLPNSPRAKPSTVSTGTSAASNAPCFVPSKRSPNCAPPPASTLRRLHPSRPVCKANLFPRPRKRKAPGRRAPRALLLRLTRRRR